MPEARCDARSALFITKTSSHHFEIFSSLRDSLITSMTSVRVALFIDLRTNGIFVTLSSALRREPLIAQIGCRPGAPDVLKFLRIDNLIVSVTP